MQTQLAGSIIGTYEVYEPLGAGGMGSVHRARDLERGRMVALKILPPHLAANPTVRRRFLREAQMATRLRHPNILPVYEFGEAGGSPYIAMKLMDGGTLAGHIKAGPLHLPFAATVLAGVAAALDYAHSQGIIHRDLKPENILFDRSGRVYLADFGIAHVKQAAEPLTTDGDFLGTAAYASPEQCRGEPLTPASDIYSLGVVLYEMITGVQPYRGASSLAVIHQHISEAAPNPLGHRADLPLGMHEVIRKALAKLPTVRYQSATALSTAFNEVLRRELGATVRASTDTPPPSPVPVFENPTRPVPPALPDDLLLDLTPTHPAEPVRPPLTPPPARLLVHGEDHPTPPGPPRRTARPTPPPRQTEWLVLGSLLLVLISLAIILLVVILS